MKKSVLSLKLRLFVATEPLKYMRALTLKSLTLRYWSLDMPVVSDMYNNLKLAAIREEREKLYAEYCVLDYEYENAAALLVEKIRKLSEKRDDLLQELGR